MTSNSSSSAAVRFVIVGFDGLRPDSVEADMPALSRFMASNHSWSHYRDLGSHGSAGKSAENGESDKTLLHFFFPLMVDKRQSGRGSRRSLRTSSDSTAP